MKNKTLPLKIIRKIAVSHTYADPEKRNPQEYHELYTGYIQKIDSPTQRHFEKHLEFRVRGGEC